MQLYKRLFLYTFLLFFISSCGIFNQNHLFQSKDEKNPQDIIGDSILKKASEVVSNYKIHESDQLELKVFTNKGERIVDPNGEFLQSIAGLGAGASLALGSGGLTYTVMQDGTAAFPMVGVVLVKDLTTRQLDSLLQIKYAVYYQDVYVVTKCVNRRVIVMGNQAGNSSGVGGAIGGVATGGGISAEIITLTNEKMNLIEVLALAGGLDEQAISYKIKLIRGNLNNPNVYHVDLSTIEGMKKSQMYVQPNDIIYVERMRKPLRQVVRELSPFFSIFSFATTLGVLIITLTKK